jgi:hypothetical protein
VSRRDYRAEVDALPKADLISLMEQAAQVLADHADDCRGDDCEHSYRLECETVLRGAEMLRDGDLAGVPLHHLLDELQRRGWGFAITKGGERLEGGDR